jgi:putative acetyltransferase
MPTAPWIFVDFSGHAAQPELAEALEAVWLAAWRRTMPQIDFAARLGWLRAHLTGSVEAGARVRVALGDGGRVVGFVLIDPASHYLDQIAVDPLHWGTGAAAVLLAEARRLSPDRVRLDVNADNPRAVTFYRRAGFAVVGSGVNARSGLATLTLEWRPDVAGSST